MIKIDMGYSGRRGDERKMARDQETKKRAERRKGLRMDNLGGRRCMKQRDRKKNYSWRTTQEKEEGRERLEMDRGGKQESEVLEIK